MKVLHCVPTFDVGGLGSFALELIRAWKRLFPEDRHVVQAALFPATKPLLRGAFNALLTPINCVEVKRNLLNPEAYWTAVRVALSSGGRNGWDAVLVYNVFDLPWVCRGIRGAGFRGTLHVHVGTHIEQRERDMGPVISEIPGARRFIFPCEAVMRTTLTIPGFDPRTAGPVIYNGVNQTRFREVQRPAESSRAPRFGFVGRMEDNAKDWRNLIESFAGIENASLVLAGDGSHRAEYEKLALSRRAPVTFLGSIDPEKMPSFLATLDAFVMAALPIEGFSMALIEAMTAGLPIIASNVPSNREALGDDTGILVPVGDYRAAVETLAGDASLRQTLRLRSLGRASLFSIDTCVTRYRETMRP